MGTSSPYGGPGGKTPLVPSWLDGGGLPPGGAPPDGNPQAPDGAPDGMPPAGPPPQQIDRPAIPPAVPGRFTAPRNSLTRYARSGGNDRRSLGRAISGYVSSASGGAATAAKRMGSSRTSSAKLVGFLTNVSSNGPQAALRELRLDSLVGRPVEEIFLGLADYICPAPDTLDEAIARNAFIETVAELADIGITDLNTLTMDQIQIFLEHYISNSIEARICNDIGAKVVSVPTDPQAAQRVQDQLQDFIRRGVSDALTNSRTQLDAITPEHIPAFIEQVYESAFNVLQTLGEQEAEEQ